MLWKDAFPNLPDLNFKYMLVALELSAFEQEADA